MVFENGVKNIQAAAYNGARSVCNMQNMYGKLNTYIHITHIVQSKKNKTSDWFNGLQKN